MRVPDMAWHVHKQIGKPTAAMAAASGGLLSLESNSTWTIGGAAMHLTQPSPLRVAGRMIRHVSTGLGIAAA
eukprot:458488-Rhodomonas_salina.4